MVVAVIAMRMMKPAVDQVIDMIAMWDRFVAASPLMHMLGIMPLVPEFRRAAGWILCAHLDDMFLDDVACLMVQMAVVEIVDVVAMFDGDVTAFRAVLVRMVGVNAMAVRSHLVSFPSFKR